MGPLKTNVTVKCVLLCLVPPHTWEVNSSINRRTCCNRGMDQVWVLQPEPSSERTWVRPTKRHPLPVGQPSGLCHDSAEVCQVSQRLATAEETQAVCAEVTKKTEEGIQIVQLNTSTTLI